MEIPGMNPMQNRIIVPGQAQPAAPQTQVPDLILDAPQNRTPTAQPQAPTTTGPYQAPAQAVITQVYQDMTSALMEMGMSPTPQNQQMASLLAGYGNAVNSQTMGVLRQAMAQLSDKSPASLEAAVILLSKDLPVNDQTVSAIKQLLNGQPLPAQLQNLPKEMAALLQQLQQTAQNANTGQSAPLLNAQPTAQATAQAAAAQGAEGQTNTAQAQQTTQAAGAQAPAAAQAPQAGNAQATVQGTAQGAAQGLTQAQLQTQIQTGQNAAQNVAQQAGQQVAQTIQSGQAAVQAAPTSAIVQQAVGQAQTTENRADAISRLSERSTAEKVAVPDMIKESLPAIEEVDGRSGQTGQPRQVVDHMPASARPNDQEALHQLYLHLRGGEIPTVEPVGPGGAASVQSPEEAVLRLLSVIQDLGQIAGHLGENMQLRDFKQLYIQHQQIMQLTGLLETKLQEFHQLFARAFPELAEEVQRLLGQDGGGQDIFSKLAKLIDDNQAQLQAKLRLPGNEEVQSQVLTTLSQLMEQVGVHVEKIQANMMAREMLAQNLPIHVVPLTVHFRGEAYPAEIYVQQDYDPEDHSTGPDGQRPFKLTFTLETISLGRVSVDLATLKDDMTLDLKVQSRRIKLLVDEQLQNLKHKVEREGDYTLSHVGCRVVPDLENRQSMLLPPKREIRSLRRVEGVV
ncbi:MAG: hypothetical protein ACAI44_31980 [Candidatus Sericytochromatia bacterium]